MNGTYIFHIMRNRDIESLNFTFKNVTKKQKYKIKKQIFDVNEYDVLLNICCLSCEDFTCHISLFKYKVLKIN